MSKVLTPGALAGSLRRNKYKQRVSATRQGDPQSAQQSPPVDRRAERLIEALTIPQDVRESIDRDMRSAKQTLIA